jgi:hypothetical protein
MQSGFWNKRLTIIFLTMAALLSLPFIAMQFGQDVKWSLFDFVAAGTLLTITAVLFEVVIRVVKTTRYRIAICAGLLLLLLLVWLELAVGIFGTPMAGS